MTNDLPFEYAVFVYIPNHLKRLQTNIFSGHGISLQYKFYQNRLYVKDYPSNFLYKTYILKLIYLLIDRQKEENLGEYRYKSFMLANEIFLESKKLLERKFPGIKFIILNYQTVDDWDADRLELPFMFDVLEKEGFIVINSSDLIGRKFKNKSEDTVFDGYHPSEKAWDELLPMLVKKLDSFSD